MRRRRLVGTGVALVLSAAAGTGSAMAQPSNERAGAPEVIGSFSAPFQEPLPGDDDADDCIEEAQSAPDEGNADAHPGTVLTCIPAAGALLVPSSNDLAVNSEGRETFDGDDVVYWRGT
jgi:hypothetical protein